MQLAPIVALEMLGMKNTDGDRSRDFYVNTIRQIERITGMTLFPNIPEEIENSVRDEAALRAWDNPIIKH